MRCLLFLALVFVSAFAQPEPASNELYTDFPLIDISTNSVFSGTLQPCQWHHLRLTVNTPPANTYYVVELNSDKSTLSMTWLKGASATDRPYPGHGSTVPVSESYTDSTSGQTRYRITPIYLTSCLLSSGTYYFGLQNVGGSSTEVAKYSIIIRSVTPTPTALGSIGTTAVTVNNQRAYTSQLTAYTARVAQYNPLVEIAVEISSVSGGSLLAPSLIATTSSGLADPTCTVGYTREEISSDLTRYIFSRCALKSGDVYSLSVRAASATDSQAGVSYSLSIYTRTQDITTLKESIPTSGQLTLSKDTRLRIRHYVIQSAGMNDVGSRMKFKVSNVYGGSVSVTVNKDTPAGSSTCTQPLKGTCSTQGTLSPSCTVVLERCAFSAGTWYVAVEGLEYAESVDHTIRYTIVAETLHDTETTLVSGQAYPMTIGEAMRQQFSLQIATLNPEDHLLLEVYMDEFGGNPIDVYLAPLGAQPGPAPCYSSFRSCVGTNRSCIIPIEHCDMKAGFWTVSVFAASHFYYDNPVPYTLTLTRKNAAAITHNTPVSSTMIKNQYHHYALDLTSANPPAGAYIEPELTNLDPVDSASWYLNPDALAGATCCYSYLTSTSQGTFPTCTFATARRYYLSVHGDKQNQALAPIGYTMTAFLRTPLTIPLTVDGDWDPKRPVGSRQYIYYQATLDSSADATSLTFQIRNLANAKNSTVMVYAKKGQTATSWCYDLPVCVLSNTNTDCKIDLCSDHSGTWYFGVYVVSQDYYSPVTFDARAFVTRPSSGVVTLSNAVEVRETRRYDQTHYKMVVDSSMVSGKYLQVKVANIKYGQVKVYLTKNGLAGPSYTCRSTIAYCENSVGHPDEAAYCVATVPTCQLSQGTWYVMVARIQPSSSEPWVDYSITATSLAIPDAVALTSGTPVVGKVHANSFAYYTLTVPASQTNHEQLNLLTYVNILSRLQDAGVKVWLDTAPVTCPLSPPSAPIATVTSFNYYNVPPCKTQHTTLYLSVLGIGHNPSPMPYYYGVPTTFTLQLGVDAPVAMTLDKAYTMQMSIPGTYQHFVFDSSSISVGQYVVVNLANIRGGDATVYVENRFDTTLAGVCDPANCRYQNTLSTTCVQKAAGEDHECILTLPPCVIEESRSSGAKQIHVSVHADSITNPATTPLGYTITARLAGSVKALTDGVAITGQTVGINNVVNFQFPLSATSVPAGAQIYIELTNQRHGNLTLSVNRGLPAGRGCYSMAQKQWETPLDTDPTAPKPHTLLLSPCDFDWGTGGSFTSTTLFVGVDAYALEDPAVLASFDIKLTVIKPIELGTLAGTWTKTLSMTNPNYGTYYHFALAAASCGRWTMEVAGANSEGVKVYLGPLRTGQEHCQGTGMVAPCQTDSQGKCKIDNIAHQGGDFYLAAFNPDATHAPWTFTLTMTDVACETLPLDQQKTYSLSEDNHVHMRELTIDTTTYSVATAQQLAVTVSVTAGDSVSVSLTGPAYSRTQTVTNGVSYMFVVRACPEYTPGKYTLVLTETGATSTVTALAHVTVTKPIAYPTAQGATTTVTGSITQAIDGDDLQADVWVLDTTAYQPNDILTLTLTYEEGPSTLSLYLLENSLSSNQPCCHNQQTITSVAPGSNGKLEMGPCTGLAKTVYYLSVSFDGTGTHSTGKYNLKATLTQRATFETLADTKLTVASLANGASKFYQINVDPNIALGSDLGVFLRPTQGSVKLMMRTSSLVGEACNEWSVDCQQDTTCLLHPFDPCTALKGPYFVSVKATADAAYTIARALTTPQMVTKDTVKTISATAPIYYMYYYDYTYKLGDTMKIAITQNEASSPSTSAQVYYNQGTPASAACQLYTCGSTSGTCPDNDIDQCVRAARGSGRIYMSVLPSAGMDYLASPVPALSLGLRLSVTSLAGSPVEVSTTPKTYLNQALTDPNAVALYHMLLPATLATSTSLEIRLGTTSTVAPRIHVTTAMTGKPTPGAAGFVFPSRDCTAPFTCTPQGALSSLQICSPDISPCQVGAGTHVYMAVYPDGDASTQSPVLYNLTVNTLAPIDLAATGSRYGFVYHNTYQSYKMNYRVAGTIGHRTDRNRFAIKAQSESCASAPLMVYYSRAASAGPECYSHAPCSLSSGVSTCTLDMAHCNASSGDWYMTVKGVQQGDQVSPITHFASIDTTDVPVIEGVSGKEYTLAPGQNLRIYADTLPSGATLRVALTQPSEGCTRADLKLNRHQVVDATNPTDCTLDSVYTRDCVTHAYPNTWPSLCVDSCALWTTKSWFITPTTKTCTVMALLEYSGIRSVTPTPLGTTTINGTTAWVSSYGEDWLAEFPATDLVYPRTLTVTTTGDQDYSFYGERPCAFDRLTSEGAQICHGACTLTWAPWEWVGVRSYIHVHPRDAYAGEGALGYTLPYSISAQYGSPSTGLTNMLPYCDCLQGNYKFYTFTVGTWSANSALQIDFADASGSLQYAISYSPNFGKNPVWSTAATRYDTCGHQAGTLYIVVKSSQPATKLCYTITVTQITAKVEALRAGFSRSWFTAAGPYSYQHYVLPITAGSLGSLGAVTVSLGPTYDGSATGYIMRGRVGSAQCYIGSVLSATNPTVTLTALGQSTCVSSDAQGDYYYLAVRGEQMTTPGSYIEFSVSMATTANSPAKDITVPISPAMYTFKDRTAAAERWFRISRPTDAASRLSIVSDVGAQGTLDLDVWEVDGNAFPCGAPTYTISNPAEAFFQPCGVATGYIYVRATLSGTTCSLTYSLAFSWKNLAFTALTNDQQTTGTVTTAGGANWYKLDVPASATAVVLWTDMSQASVKITAQRFGMGGLTYCPAAKIFTTAPRAGPDGDNYMVLGCGTVLTGSWFFAVEGDSQYTIRPQIISLESVAAGTTVTKTTAAGFRAFMFSTPVAAISSFVGRVSVTQTDADPALVMGMSDVQCPLLLPSVPNLAMTSCLSWNNRDCAVDVSIKPDARKTSAYYVTVAVPSDLSFTYTPTVSTSNCHNMAYAGEWCSAASYSYSTWSTQEYRETGNDSVLINRAVHRYEQIRDFVRSTCNMCDMTACEAAMKRYACLDTFRRCDANGFIHGVCTWEAWDVIGKCCNDHFYKDTLLAFLEPTANRYEFEDGVCTGGFRPSQCPENCNGASHGECIQTGTSAYCKCKDGYKGDSCGTEVCPGACNGHGTCNMQTGKCSCNPYYVLSDCSRYEASGCYHNCTSADQGTCVQTGSTFACQCQAGWGGPSEDCSGIICPHNCHHGTCVMTSTSAGKCDCQDSFTGIECTVSDCNGHGTWNEAAGKCDCQSPWVGDFCAAQTCTEKPNMQWDPVSKMCVCVSPWTGDNCDQADCFHGTWDGSKCVCESGWHNSASNQPCNLINCPVADCYGHGTCGNATCTCTRRWTPPDCGTAPACSPDPNCSGHGTCTGGICDCSGPWNGDACATPKCFNGTLTTNNTCQCTTGYFGTHCLTYCDPTLSTYRSDLDACQCTNGLAGPKCDQHCPSDCSGHGVCTWANSTAVCVCAQGFNAPACTPPGSAALAIGLAVPLSLLGVGGIVALILFLLWRRRRASSASVPATMSPMMSNPLKPTSPTANFPTALSTQRKSNEESLLGTGL
ncbi:putative tenascin precursor [Paratrimastix pyriformis]|uniref:Tenascin n=1 Tax=Paratrimastix pyriformis TaxID=342808 RepID=A0ABQ8UT77_9EUKA|nr:putative tenascin precursor [Paratrimastix pyriformis]